MRYTPERKAWLIISGAFFIFWVIFFSVSLTAVWYLFYSTYPFPTEATSVRGIVLLDDPSTQQPISIPNGNTTTLYQGVTVKTDSISQAILAFTDNSNLTLYADTEILIAQTQTPRFSFGLSPSTIAIKVVKGRIRATVARQRADLEFDITTPHLNTALNQGSFSIAVSPEETQLTTRLGQATAFGNHKAILLPQGKRIVVGTDHELSDPLPAAQNLLANQQFTTAFTGSWTIYREVEQEGITTSVQTITMNADGQTALEFRSSGENERHTEIGVIQQVGKDVRDFRSLRVSAEVQLINQSLEGGGYVGTEFPIMLSIAYKDSDNNDRDWYHGFYYAPPPENYFLDNRPGHSNDGIARFVWYPYESDNLLTILGREKPVYIKSIRIYASGWLYQARVANVSLLAQE